MAFIDEIKTYVLLCSAIHHKTDVRVFKYVEINSEHACMSIPHCSLLCDMRACIRLVFLIKI